MTYPYYPQPVFQQPKHKLSTTAKVAIVLLAVAGVIVATVFASTYYVSVTGTVTVTSPITIQGVAVGTLPDHNDILASCTITGNTVTCGSLPSEPAGTNLYVTMNVTNTATTPTQFNVWYISGNTSVMTMGAPTTSQTCTVTSSTESSCAVPYNTKVTLVFELSLVQTGSTTFTIYIGV
jgi:hypothetical protein